MGNDKVSNFQERLYELMATYKISQTALCKRTGLNKAVVSLYVNGKREPMQDNIVTIADTFNINPAWLIGYDVPMRTPSSNAVDIKREKEMARFYDEMYIELLESYDKLTDKQRESVKAIINSMIKP